LIFNEDGQQLTNTKIWDHNLKENYITVKEVFSLIGVIRCNLLILTAPAPYAYRGIIMIRDSEAFIKLHDEHVTENRRETRYKTNLQGNIESLVYGEKSYPLLKALEAQIIDISKSGLRIFVKDNTMNEGDIFVIRIKLGEGDKFLTATAVNSRLVPPDQIEHGCRLVSKEGDAHG
jgi:hypothetical protein